MDCVELADEIASHLQPLLTGLPDGFHDSFAFTQTGNNLTHPVTLGLLCRILWDMPQFTLVAIDLRLNLGDGVKFQPDLACLGSGHAPTALVDYESPNSSDARVPVKDVDSHLRWQSRSALSVPYIIVTTLPNRRRDGWELRYTSSKGCNVDFRNRRDEVRQNPFRFWYAFYLNEFSKRDMKNISLVNIDGRNVQRVYPA